MSIFLEVSRIDPLKYNDIKQTEDLYTTIDDFFKSNNDIFLLLSEAGSGKSTSLQIKFIDAVEKWDSGMPLPIYFNLANGINI